MAQLKQENDELRQELKEAREEKPSLQHAAAVTEQAASRADEVGMEKNILRQEIHALQVRTSSFLNNLWRHFNQWTWIMRTTLLAILTPATAVSTGPLCCKV